MAWHAILPILTLVLVSVGPSIYVVRTMTMSVAQDDHVMLAPAMFAVFDNDTRTDPMHGRKMTAALQHATAGTRPCGARAST